MDDFDYEEFNKRYDKFKDNNLPTPYFDNERQVMEYISFDPHLIVDNDLIYPLENLNYASFYYPYNIKDYMRRDPYDDMKLQYGHTHSHHFREVVHELYMHPESFSIDKSDYRYYSNQELKYLFMVKAYLNLIQMKDSYKNDDNRYHNLLHNKYKDSLSINVNDNLLNKYRSKELKYFIDDYKNDKYENTNRNMLIINNYQYKLFIKIIKKEIVLYKEVKNDYHKPLLNDGDQVIKYTFKILEDLNN